jgi:hypothetical protein
MPNPWQKRTAEAITRQGFNVRVKDMAHYAADALPPGKLCLYHHEHLR